MIEIPAIASLMQHVGASQSSSAATAVPISSVVDARLDSSGWVVNQRGGLAGVNPIMAGVVVMGAILALLWWRK